MLVQIIGASGNLRDFLAYLPFYEVNEKSVARPYVNLKRKAKCVTMYHRIGLKKENHSPKREYIIFPVVFWCHVGNCIPFPCLRLVTALLSPPSGRGWAASCPGTASRNKMR